MSRYNTMQVCKKWGHKITKYYDSQPNKRQDYCDKCGSETIYKCVNCSVKIRGHYKVEGVVSAVNEPVSYNCHNCGSNYPWKYRLIIKRGFSNIFKPFDKIIEVIVKIFSGK